MEFSPANITKMSQKREPYFIINVNPPGRPYTYICNMNTVFLLLGTNLGDKHANLLLAEKGIRGKIGKSAYASSVYSTDAWGNEKQDAFLNRALCVTTPLSASDVLSNILLIEKEMGRVRRSKWEARLIDIDILFYNSEIIKTGELIVPHPHLHERKFALKPLFEIAPGFIHPEFNKPISLLLSECTDTLRVSKVA